MNGQSGVLPQTLGSRLFQLAFVLAVLVGWIYLTEGGIVHRIVLPPPGDVLRQIPGVVTSKRFLLDLWTTLYEIVVAFLGAAVAGVLLGYYISRATVRIRAYEPLLSGIFAMPMVLFYPIFVLTFGLGPASKIAVGGLIGFFPIVLATIAGFSGVARVHITAARTMGASNWQMLRYVMLPGALPVIATGLRTGLVVTLLTVFGSETLGSREGLGFNMIALAEEMDTAKTYVYILAIVVIAILLNMLATEIERRMQPAGARE